MAEYAKAFAYDARGCDIEALEGKIDADVSDYLTTVGATHFNDMTVSIGKEQVVVFMICDDAL